MEGKEREISLVLGKTDLRARLAQVLEMDDRASKQKDFEYELTSHDRNLRDVSGKPRNSHTGICTEQFMEWLIW